MILFLIFVAIFVISIVIESRDPANGLLDTLAMSGTMVAGSALLISAVLIIHSHINTSGDYDALMQKRNAIEHQMETGEHDNNLFEQIGDFNEGVVFNQSRSHNLWISWYYPSYYDEVKPIGLD